MLKTRILGIVLLLVGLIILVFSIILTSSLLSSSNDFSNNCYENSQPISKDEEKFLECLEKSKEIKHSSNALSLLLILITLTSGVSFLVKGVRFVK